MSSALGRSLMRKKSKGQPTDLVAAVELFMESELLLGKDSPSINTGQFSLERGISGGCKVRPTDASENTSRNALQRFTALTDMARKLRPKAKAELVIGISSGGHTVAFAGRSSRTRSRRHRKTFGSPKEFEAWIRSSNHRGFLGWTCMIERL